MQINCCVPLRLLLTALIIVSLSVAVASAAENTTAGNDCQPPSLQCMTECMSCIPQEKICNNFKDCFDGTDETLAACVFAGKLKCDSKTPFQCQNGQCISNSQTCNGKDDCGDNSDESLTICKPTPKPCDTSTNFKCKNDNCIPNKLTCDGKDDCGDSSDEDLYFGPECRSKGFCHYQDQFRCKNDNCVKDDSKVCDGYDDCGDCSDELPELCHSRQCNSRTHFRCKTGLCVPQSKVHNWINNCFDWSDESDTFWFWYRQGSCRYCYPGRGSAYQTYC